MGPAGRGCRFVAASGSQAGKRSPDVSCLALHKEKENFKERPGQGKLSGSLGNGRQGEHLPVLLPFFLSRFPVREREAGCAMYFEGLQVRLTRSGRRERGLGSGLDHHGNHG